MYTNEKHTLTDKWFKTKVRDYWPLKEVCIANIWQSKKWYFGVCFPQWNIEFAFIDTCISLKRFHISILGFGFSVIYERTPNYTLPTPELVAMYNKASEERVKSKKESMVKNASHKNQ